MQELIKQVQEACATACDDKAQKALIAQVGDQGDLSNIMLRHHACAHVDCAAAIRALDLSHLSKASNAESITMDDLSAKLAEFIAIKSPDKDEWYGPENEMYRDCINEFLDFVNGYPAP